MFLPDPARDLALRQFGAVARRQLLAWMTHGEISGLVRRDTLVAIQRGVYRVRGGAVTPEQEAMAAVLRVPGSRVAGPFALGLYGAEGFSRADQFVLLVPADRWPRGVDVRMAVDPCPGRFDAMWDSGLPVVTPTFACLDAAQPRRSIGDRVLRIAVDSLRWSGLTSTPRLAAAAADLPGHLGARRILRMLDDLTLVSESEQERRLGAIVDTLDPRPERQAWIAGHRVDFLWPLLLVILEFDGGVHDRPDRRVADAQRDGQLSAAGYLVIRVRDVDLRDPAALRIRLEAILARRARELGLAGPVAS